MLYRFHIMCVSCGGELEHLVGSVHDGGRRGCREAKAVVECTECHLQHALVVQIVATREESASARTARLRRIATHPAPAARLSLAAGS